ncbi:MAG: phosphorylase family protein [Steroidobacteraceae bacterium]
MGVVTALMAEARALGKSVRRPDGLASLGDGTLLAVGGMGGEPAARAARRLVDAGVAGLLSFGFAGGLDPSLSAGTVVCPTEIISGSGARIATSADWRERLRVATAAPRPLVGGTLLTCSAPIDSVAGKAVAFRDTGAVAVDMESLSVAQVAAAYGLPFIAVRVIVDTAADRLPQAVLAANRAGSLSVGRLLGGLARAPSELPALIRLAQRYRAAARALTAVARAAVSTPQVLGTRLV